MSTTATDPAPISPVTRWLRTIAQALAAGLVVLPLLVAFMATLGIELNAPGLVATFTAALALVAGAQNALEAKGLIGTAGARDLVDWSEAFTPLATLEVTEGQALATTDDLDRLRREVRVSAAKVLTAIHAVTEVHAAAADVTAAAAEIAPAAESVAVARAEHAAALAELAAARAAENEGR